MKQVLRGVIRGAQTSFISVENTDGQIDLKRSLCDFSMNHGWCIICMKKKRESMTQTRRSKTRQKDLQVQRRFNYGTLKGLKR